MQDRWPSQIRIDYIDAIFRSAVTHEDEKCAICHEPLNNKEELMAPCKNGHIFHCSCITEWLLEYRPNPKCPLCYGKAYIRDCFMRSDLAIATYAGDKEKVTTLLDAHIDGIDELTVYTYAYKHPNIRKQKVSRDHIGYPAFE